MSELNSLEVYNSVFNINDTTLSSNNFLMMIWRKMLSVIDTLRYEDETDEYDFLIWARDIKDERLGLAVFNR